MLTEGVHQGSGGAFFYSSEELQKFPAAWNGVPLTVHHPVTQEGIPISANSPDIITDWSIGRVFNVQFVGGKLKGEAWVDVALAQELAPEVLSLLNSGADVEISTGLFSEDDSTPGEWNGEKYTATVRNFRPDHLALLPGGQGACSFSDGCGVRANNQGGQRMITNEASVQDVAVEIGKTKEDGVLKTLAKRLAGLLGFSVQELSHEDVREQLRSAVNKAKVDSDSWLWVRDVFDNYFVYELEASDGSIRLFKQDYSVSDNQVLLGGTPMEVVEETSYTIVNEGNSPTADNANPKEKEGAMKKCCPEKVTALIGNAKNNYTEDDRTWLENLSEEQFNRVAESSVKKETPTGNATPPEGPEFPKAATVDDYINNAPAGIREVLQDGLTTHQKRKAELVAGLLANKRCSFTKEHLEAKGLSELETLSQLAGIDVNYQGKASGSAPVVDNAAEEPLDTLDLTFEK
jgi:hypothetical protein